MTKGGDDTMYVLRRSVRISYVFLSSYIVWFYLLFGHDLFVICTDILLSCRGLKFKRT